MELVGLEDSVRLILKLLAFVILAPLALGFILIAAIAALVAVPMMWEAIIARITAPPRSNGSQT